MYGLPLEFYGELYAGLRLPIAGDHTTLTVTSPADPPTDYLDPGLYALEAEGASCYVAAGLVPVAGATCRWIRDGGGMYLVVQAANSVKIAALRSGTVDGVLHISRVG